MSHGEYHYKVVEDINIVDGDTIDCRLSLGFGMSAAFRFRLADVNTPEIFGKHAGIEGEDGKRAKQFVFDWFNANRGNVWAQTFKGSQSTVGIGDGAFGRWLADFYADDDHLTHALIDVGYCKNYEPGERP